MTATHLPAERRAAEVFDLAGRVVWVTGSSRGIGRGIAAHLAQHGASVVVHGRSARSTEEVVEELASIGATVLPVAADVRDDAALDAALRTIDATFGRLDGVVANVGGAAIGELAGIDAERFTRQLQLNLVAPFATLRCAHRLLAEASGAAVLIGAVAASNPTPQFGPYGAAKAGLEQLVRSMAAEWGPAVRVNAVSPGLIRTEGSMQSVFHGSQELVERAGRTTAVGRVGEPVDVAWACHYLLSPAASYVSGAVLVVDGGPVEGPAQRILRAVGTP